MFFFFFFYYCFTSLHIKKYTIHHTGMSNRYKLLLFLLGEVTPEDIKFQTLQRCIEDYEYV